jgi:hypothetical protein
MRRFILPAVIGSLIVAGCAREERPPAPSPRPVPVRPRPPAVPAATPADYVARAANPRIRDFAREMMRDHAGTSGQLSLAGRRLNL